MNTSEYIFIILQTSFEKYFNFFLKMNKANNQLGDQSRIFHKRMQIYKDGLKKRKFTSSTC